MELSNSITAPAAQTITSALYPLTLSVCLPLWVNRAGGRKGWTEINGLVTPSISRHAEGGGLIECWPLPALFELVRREENNRGYKWVRRPHSRVNLSSMLLTFLLEADAISAERNLSFSFFWLVLWFFFGGRVVVQFFYWFDRGGRPRPVNYWKDGWVG